MKGKKIFWQFLRGLALALLLFFLYLFIVSLTRWFEIIQLPFDGEGNYFDPISEISYHNGPFFAASGQLIFSLVSLVVSFLAVLLYKWATHKVSSEVRTKKLN